MTRPKNVTSSTARDTGTTSATGRITAVVGAARPNLAVARDPTVMLTSTSLASFAIRIMANQQLSTDRVGIAKTSSIWIIRKIESAAATSR